MKTQTVFCQEGSADKQYTVTLQEQTGTITVIGYGGRRGGTLTAYPKYQGTSVAAAETAFSKLLREKLAKGYKPGPDAAMPNAPLGKVEPTATEWRPMLLNAIADAEPYIKSDQWMMQEKADGVRAIIHISNDVRAYSRTGLPVTLSADSAAVLDVLFDQCIIDAEVIGERVVVFDILSRKGVDMRSYPAEDRLRAVHTLYGPGPRKGTVPSGIVQLVTTATTELEKRQMLSCLNHDGAEGVVFKRVDAPYKAGRPSSGGPALKLKFTASASLRVVEIGRDGKSSVTVALEDGTEVASVSTLGREIPRLKSIVEVAYLYAYRGGSLVQPVYKTIRTDKKRADSAESLQYKGEER